MCVTLLLRNKIKGMEERDLGVHKRFMVCDSNILFNLKENCGCGLAEKSLSRQKLVRDNLDRFKMIALN